MGLNPRLIALSFTSLLLTSMGLLDAAPKLRLMRTTVGPVSTSTGQNGATQTVEAFNVGDGTLNLSASASVTWLAPTVGASGPCISEPGTCFPVRIELRTSSLAKGQFTGTVTVTDPAALDAPQTITVTVNVGGGVPDSLSLYAAPGGRAGTTFSTTNPLGIQTTTTSGGSWLSVPAEAGGSFRFVWNYQVSANAASLGENTYNGQFVTSGSTVPAENKTVPVTFRVTSQPAISVQPAQVWLQMMQGSYSDPANQGPPTYIAVSNTAGGSLAVSGVTPTTSDGGTWLQAQSIAGGQYVQLNTKPGSLAPGTYTATVKITSNAINGDVTVPVTMVVLPTGPPLAFANGAVNNATAVVAGDPIAQGAIVSLYGQFMLGKDPVTNSVLPLPTDLGGTRVLVNGVAAPLYYASDGQINFQMPYETGEGDATIQVERAGVLGNKISSKIQRIFSRILLYGATPIVINNSDGSWATFTAIPGVTSRPAKPGEAIIIYMIGGGQTSPAATTGAAVALSPLSYAQAPVTVTFGGLGPIGGGIVKDALFGGLTPAFVGLYQVNVVIPDGVPRNSNVSLRVSIGGQQSNQVLIAIQ
jgi:uncharacterized protein (TIGR03437 family)